MNENNITKIKAYEIGGCGQNIVRNIKNNERLSKILIDCDITHLNINSIESPNVDMTILYGTKGLGSGGHTSKGFKFAKETLYNHIQIFENNLINIFVIGLGGGSGTGIAKFILEKLNSKNEKSYFNKCNIVIATKPLNIEKQRIEKSKINLKDISKLSDLFFSIDMQSIKDNGLDKDINVKELFKNIKNLVIKYISRLSKNTNNEILQMVESINKEENIVEIKSISDFDKYLP